LVASYDLWPGNGAGLFWKEHIDKSRSKQGRKHKEIRKQKGRKEGRKLSKHRNKRFIWRQNQHMNHGALLPRSPHGAPDSDASYTHTKGIFKSFFLSKDVV